MMSDLDCLWLPLNHAARVGLKGCQPNLSNHNRINYRIWHHLDSHCDILDISLSTPKIKTICFSIKKLSLRDENVPNELTQGIG